MMVNYSTNINKTKYLKHKAIEQKKDHDIWLCKARSWFGTGTTMWPA